MTRRLVVFGLSLSSSWGNGHAPTFRGLLRALAGLGWSITFFERDVEWYRSNRDLPEPDFCDLRFYDAWPTVRGDVAPAVHAADVVLVGSLVADGPSIIDWLATQDRPLFYYDIDTPITLVELARSGQTDYLRSDQIRLFQTYFSFAGGRALDELEGVWGARHAEALYCGVDTAVYRPVASQERFECALSYLGTYAPDRQPAVDEMLFAPARALSSERCFLAGAQYPPMDVPANVRHQVHVYQRDHAALYCSSRATLNLTRQSMRKYGWAPSTRLFEAGACGAGIISDTWPGLDSIFEPNREVLLAETRHDVLRHLEALSPERRKALGDAARARVLRDHTYERRAEQVEAAFHKSTAGTRVELRQWANAS
jgi:spore maturation protein CgeB